LEAVDVNRVVMEAVRMTRPRWKDEPEAHGAPIAVETHLGEVPPIQGTTSGLHDALVNLIFNAVAAMPDGGAITIETQRAAAGVELICRDTGIGMNEETRRRVFEPFFTTRRDVGSGLGLSMADAAVTAWGGRISVESAPRAGTTFTILLPLWTGSQSQPGGAPPTSGPSRPARLLLVEDDEATSRVVSHLLSGQHQVDVVADGPAALAQLVPGRYDAALIDLGLPGMPGDRVRQEIAQVDAAVVGVLITGWVLEAGDPRMRGFELALQKPFADAAALHEAVAQAVRLHDARARRQNGTARGDSFGQAS
jgi:CheY-like chemotaxis protein